MPVALPDRLVHLNQVAACIGEHRDHHGPGLHGRLRKGNASRRERSEIHGGGATAPMRGDGRLVSLRRLFARHRRLSPAALTNMGATIHRAGPNVAVVGVLPKRDKDDV
jgi:hypothetical protein